MNNWWYLGPIPGLIGDLVGVDEGEWLEDSSEEYNVLDGTDGDSNYQYNEEQPSKGGFGNPNADPEPSDIIEVEENGTTYVFDRDGNYVTEYPSSEREYHEVYVDSDGNVIHNQADPPQTSTSTSTTTMTPFRDENGNLIYIDGNGNIIYPDSYMDEHGNTISTKPDVDEDQEPVLDENGNWIFVDSNGNPVNPNTFMDGNGNTYVVHPTTGEQFNVNEDDEDDESEEYFVPILAPMVDYSGKTYYVDGNGNTVDGNGNPYTPVTKPEEVIIYVDELGNPIETPSNNNNNTNNTSNNVNNNTNNNNSNNVNNNTNNTNNNDIVIRDELGDVVVREPANTTNIQIINTQDGDDRNDDFWEKNNLTPPNRNNSNTDQNNTKKINYNSTVGRRAAYYAP